MSIFEMNSLDAASYKGLLLQIVRPLDSVSNNLRIPYMRVLTSLLIICLFATQSAVLSQTDAASVPSMIDKPVVFGLPDGTPLKLRISRNLSSADAKTGETVDFEVLEEIKIGETVIIPKGGVAIGTVTRGKPKGRLGKGGKLDINIDYVRTILGEKVALRAVKENKGYNSAAPMTGAIVASSILFFPAAPFFLLLKGKDVKIPKGTEVTAYVSGNTELDSTKYLAAQTVLGGQPQTSSIGMVSVSIKSEPEGAEITIDGKYVGSTPSSVYLKSGEHTIIVTKNGFRKWERFVRLEPGSTITINATLEAVR